MKVHASLNELVCNGIYTCAPGWEGGALLVLTARVAFGSHSN